MQAMELSAFGLDNLKLTDSENRSRTGEVLVCFEAASVNARDSDPRNSEV